MLTLPATAPARARRTALGLPDHIGFIADGNRRWAAAHGTTVEQGFRQGAAAVHQVLEHCRTLGVQAASVFLMSDRNFGRSEDEVAALVDVIADLLDTEAAASTGPLRVLSTFSPTRYVPGRLAAAIRRAEETTADRPGMTVCLGIGYDGRADARQAVARALTAPDYDYRAELPVDRYLSTAGLPDPGLIVRTSGERRLSGFLLYQATDATLHFDDRYWPDYDGQALDEALAVHAEQCRTFGR
ncbi:di-trans,poly-cis-decaprenylcistransferase [Streptomyces sp. CS159]|uniref:polyprenyl diphosphate synthase n=1 Tax=Streptomyces sp. CS159 TaxID=1982762 RepID=UPI000B418C8E|nr:polyprenyl diphosphate synthase [Streptomyces sp. CS159]OVZ99510.1 di-trans,poly-cis-decaprenylcistransferase [Streptomyces sp. CS159]